MTYISALGDGTAPLCPPPGDLEPKVQGSTPSPAEYTKYTTYKDIDDSEIFLETMANKLYSSL